MFVLMKHEITISLNSVAAVYRINQTIYMKVRGVFRVQ